MIASVHHELLVPVKASIDIAERLLVKMKSFVQEKTLLETIIFSNKMIMMHTHDFLDQAIIENGAFTPFYEYGSVKNAVLEIIRLMNITI